MSDHDVTRDYTFTLTLTIRQMKTLLDMLGQSQHGPSDEDLEDLTHLKMELTRGPNPTRD